MIDLHRPDLTVNEQDNSMFPKNLGILNDDFEKRSFHHSMVAPIKELLESQHAFSPN